MLLSSPSVNKQTWINSSYHILWYNTNHILKRRDDDDTSQFDMLPTWTGCVFIKAE